ncbi:AbrB family looped-hinge helix DNA binding protein [Melghirimyces profundicolus]|uniref:AbrB family looped-hinge helix DNA binding protein n=1 Tax=Melghirimyces profundicolus TaxID=1242148 RepID=A0A2T6BG97_9BACL|nr:AbrB/MazE/SpoVT family DNA-binding domain-containing protein [Melghirimyces profundicolus]PTX55084.1 AbrB family looped-hinge helix DNA binding protein [Melghirimyces profundicolus]
MHHVNRISSKNQVTLPKQVQDLLDVREGDYITYRIEDGRVYVTKVGLIPFDEIQKLKGKQKPD